MCANKQGLAAGFRGWLVAASHQIEAHVPSMLETEASHQLFTTEQKSQAGQAVCSQLELATQPSREHCFQNRTGPGGRTVKTGNRDENRFFKPKEPDFLLIP